MFIHKIALLCLFGILAGSEGAELLLGINSNRILLDGHELKSEGGRSVALGVHGAASLTKWYDAIPPFIRLAGYMEYSRWPAKSGDQLNVCSSYSSGVSVYLGLFKTIFTGPGVGVSGLTYGQSGAWGDWSTFGTSLTYNVYLKLPGTPLAFYYKFLAVEFEKDWVYISNSFYILYDINHLLQLENKPKQK